MGLYKPRKNVRRTIAEAIDDHMREIKQEFPPGAKLTLVIRSEMLEGPLIFTNDEPDAAVAAIRSYTEQKGSVQIRN